MMSAAHGLVSRRSATALRRTVERLPEESRRAMSAGPAMCPALAAYRRGARTGYGDFAHAWDRYARGRGVRQASEEELATLIGILRDSMDADGRRTHGLPGRRNGWAGRAREAGAILENGRPVAAGGNGRPEASGAGGGDSAAASNGR